MKAWFSALRPKTLLASIGPVLLATALASKATDINLLVFIATLICALSLQITVNLANDLFDGLSGVDNEHRLGPVRAFQSGQISALALKIGIGVAIAVSVISGGFLVSVGGLAFLLLGLTCIIAALAYSAGPLPIASNSLGEVTVFIYFGLVSVIGSFYLQVMSIEAEIISYACIVGLLNSALMLVNNIRDIHSDQLANKITLAVRLGERKARQLYKILVIGALLLHIATNLGNTLILLFPLLLCLLLLPMLILAISNSHGKDLNALLTNTAKFGFVYCLSSSLAILVN